MIDPKLTRVRVEINYAADDGFRTTSTLKGGYAGSQAQIALLDGIEELSRIAALFGFADEARAKFEGAQARVAEFHKQRGGAA